MWAGRYRITGGRRRSAERPNEVVAGLLAAAACLGAHTAVLMSVGVGGAFVAAGSRDRQVL